MFQLYQKVFSIVKGAISNLRLFLATEVPSEVMKNAFYFTLKAFFGLIKNIRLTSKFVTSQPG